MNWKKNQVQTGTAMFIFEVCGFGVRKVILIQDKKKAAPENIVALR